MKPFLILLATSVAMLAACGNDYTCEELCNKAKDCPDAPEVDCSAMCDRTAKNNDAAGCTNKYDEMLSCFGDHESDINCGTATNPCEAEFNSYMECFTPWCTSNPDQCIAG